MPLMATGVAVAVALGLAACSPDDRGSTATSPTSAGNPSVSSPANPPTTTSSATATTTATAQAASTSDEVRAGLLFTPDQSDQDPAPGTELTVSDVRLGTHEGFDRVVFEFTGAGLPGYHVAYNPEPRQQASGYPLDVTGNAFLEVMIQGTPMGMVSQREDLVKAGPMNLASGTVQGVTHGGVFEADSQYVIGLDQQRPYRAYTLENPARLVIDIQQ